MAAYIWERTKKCAQQGWEIGERRPGAKLLEGK